MICQVRFILKMVFTLEDHPVSPHATYSQNQQKVEIKTEFEYLHLIFHLKFDQSMIKKSNQTLLTEERNH